MPRSEKILRFAVVLFAGILLVMLFLPAFGRMSPGARESKAAAAVRILLLACRDYAADHNGAYPPDLASLFPEYIDSEEPLRADDGSGEALPMIYVPGLASSSDPETIVIEHPVRHTGKRVVGNIGGYVRAVDPAD